MISKYALATPTADLRQIPVVQSLLKGLKAKENGLDDSPSQPIVQTDPKC